MDRSAFPPGGRGLPRVPYGDPAAGARALIAQAKALDQTEAAGHLRIALLVAERRAEGASLAGQHGVGTA